MALTDQEKTDVLYQLGWSGKTLITSSTDYSKTIADSLINLSSPIELRVRDLLARLVKIDTAISNAICRLSAKEVGDIKLRDDELYQLRREKTRTCRELSDLLDIPVTRSGSGGVSVCV
jgi:hypothetical protein